MGWFDKTLIGSALTPFEKKVEIFLKEGYEYEIHRALQDTFLSFCDQHKNLGFDVELTGLCFMAVAINALPSDKTDETKQFVYYANMATIAGLIAHTKKQNEIMHWREIKDLYIEVSSKHLPKWVIDELWSETNGNSILLMIFDEIEEKNMEKLNKFINSK